jgi:hypothetical protein
MPAVCFLFKELIVNRLIIIYCLGDDILLIKCPVNNKVLSAEKVAMVNTKIRKRHGFRKCRVYSFGIVQLSSFFEES